MKRKKDVCVCKCSIKPDLCRLRVGSQAALLRHSVAMAGWVSRARWTWPCTAGHVHPSAHGGLLRASVIPVQKSV